MVPNTPTIEAELLKELSSLARQLNVAPIFAGWSYYIKNVGQGAEPDDLLFLLVLDTAKANLQLEGFQED